MWSAIIRNNTEVKSLIMKSSPGDSVIVFLLHHLKILLQIQSILV